MNNLKPEEFHILNKNFTNRNLLRKGVYPYDYVNSRDKMSILYSILYDEHIPDEEYQHEKNVWQALKCQNMRDCHDLYLKSVVVLLLAVFETSGGIISSTLLGYIQRQDLLGLVLEKTFYNNCKILARSLANFYCQ